MADAALPASSARALNRALLARQLLLERGRGGHGAALAQVGGLQAQYAPAMYVGLWSRLEGLERDALTRALEAREIAQGTLMRVTIHLVDRVDRADFWPFALAVRQARRRTWLRTAPGVTAAEMAAAARILRRRLAEGPVTRREAEALVGRRRAAGVGLWVDVLRIPPMGTWERRRADLWALAEDELGPPGVTPAAALDRLVASYLRGFGPASRQDLASFTGMLARELQPALSRLELRRFRGPDGQELLDVPDGLLPDPETPAPVRFLPVWDATLLVHARRTGLLPEHHRPRVFHTKNPHGTATFLVDGAVAGAWRHEDGRVVLDPYDPLDRATRRALEEEGERLASFHA